MLRGWTTAQIGRALRRIALVSLAMLSPFSPEEKQSLLECADLAQLGAMMTALFELAGTSRQSPDRILH